MSGTAGVTAPQFDLGASIFGGHAQQITDPLPMLRDLVLSVLEGRVASLIVRPGQIKHHAHTV